MALDEEQHWREWLTRAGEARFWTLRLAGVLRLKPGMAGLLAFLLVSGVLILCGAVPVSPAQTWATRDVAAFGSILFFSLSIGYLLETTLHVLPASSRDLRALSASLSLDADTVDTLADAATRYSDRRLIVPTLYGIAIGLLHAGLLGHFDTLVTDARFAWAGIGFASATVIIWILMMQIAVVLADNARLFSRLGREATTIELLHTERLQPFGRNGLRPLLFILGLQTLYPLTMLGGTGLDPYAVIGLLASIGLVIWLYLLSLRGIHEALVRERGRALEAVEQSIQGCLPGRDAVVSRVIREADTARLNALLALRERLAGTRTWPIGSAVAGRMFLYVVIPPLGWLSAAFVQIGFEALLGG